jgi:hypothetical protein
LKDLSREERNQVYIDALDKSNVKSAAGKDLHPFLSQEQEGVVDPNLHGKI